MATSGAPVEHRLDQRSATACLDRARAEGMRQAIPQCVEEERRWWRSSGHRRSYLATPVGPRFIGLGLALAIENCVSAFHGGPFPS